MTSDQLHLRIRRGLHQAAPFISGGDVLRHLHGWREEIYKTPLGLSRLRRGRSCDYQTTSGHGAKHVQSSHVSPEEGCYNMSGSFRTDYHIDFTGSTTGTADSSSGSAQLIIWRTRRHHAEDNATTRAMSGGRMPRNTRSLLMTNEREFWRRAWTRAGWTTVHLHPGRRAGGMSAGTGTTERTRISYP